eukprot:1601264-Amphidinium_carterae.1
MASNQGYPTSLQNQGKHDPQSLGCIKELVKSRPALRRTLLVGTNCASLPTMPLTRDQHQTKRMEHTISASDQLLHRLVQMEFTSGELTKHKALEGECWLDDPISLRRIDDGNL